MPLSIFGEIGVSGERRFLTVMFCDLVGSTNIAAKLDAEEWRDLVGAYLDAASAAVTEFGGHVAKKLGDGLMALCDSERSGERCATRPERRVLQSNRRAKHSHNSVAGRALRTELRTSSSFSAASFAVP